MLNVNVFQPVIQAIHAWAKVDGYTVRVETVQYKGPEIPPTVYVDFHQNLPPGQQPRVGDWASFWVRFDPRTGEPAEVGGYLDPAEGAKLVTRVFGNGYPYLCFRPHPIWQPDVVDEGDGE